MSSPHLEPVFQLIPPAPRRDDPAYEPDDESFRQHLAAAEPDHGDETTSRTKTSLDRPPDAPRNEKSPGGQGDESEPCKKSLAAEPGTENRQLKKAASESADPPEDAPQYEDGVVSYRQRIATEDDDASRGENLVDTDLHVDTTDPVPDVAHAEPTQAGNAAEKGDIATVVAPAASANELIDVDAELLEDSSNPTADKTLLARLGTGAPGSTQSKTMSDSDVATEEKRTGATVSTKPVGRPGGAIAETPAQNLISSSEESAVPDAVRPSTGDAWPTSRHPQSDEDADQNKAPRTPAVDPDGEENAAANRVEVSTSDERPSEVRRRGSRAGLISAGTGHTNASSATSDSTLATSTGREQPAPVTPDSVPLGERLEGDMAATQIDDRPAPSTPTTARPSGTPPFADSPLGRPTHIGTAANEGNPTVGRQRIDPARFVARVAKALRMADERGGQLRLRLSPPELGSIRLELAVKNGAVTATIETETMAARSALLDNLPLLRERLHQQEFRVEQFDVNVRDEGGEHAHEHATENRERQRIPIPRDQRSDRGGQQDDSKSETRRIRPISRGDETLNVIA